MQRVNWILCLINFLVFYWGPQSYLKRYGGPLTKMSWEVPVAILRGAGWGMAPRFLLCLASPFATPNVFLNLRSLGWHMQGCQMRLVKIKGANRGGAEGAQAAPLAIRILMFIFLVFHQHCTVSRDRVHCKMFFGSTTGVATRSLSNQVVMNFRD